MEENHVETRAKLLTVPWVESPFLSQHLEESNLDSETKQWVRDYAEKGYLVVDSGLSNAEMDAVINDLDGQYAKGKYSYDTRIMDAWKRYPSVRNLATNETISNVLNVLYRRDPIPFQTLNFHLGTQQRAHSDCVHFHCLPHRFMCGVWVALEDVDAHNGPLFIHPGSHTLPILELRDFGLENGPEGYVQYEEYLAQLMEVQDLKPHELHLEKGQAAIWAANLVHGGCAVLDSDRTRYSQVTHYYFSDCTYYAPLSSDLDRGKLQLKTIRDIRTNKTVPHSHRWGSASQSAADFLSRLLPFRK